MTGRDLVRRGRGIAHVASPRYWRWRRFLSSLTLDPDRLVRPVKEPTERDFIICGCPRTGTTLLSAVLHQPPGCITVMEPWDGMRLAPDQLFVSLREEIDRTGALSRGKLDVDALRDQGEVQWRRERRGATPLATADGYLLGVKWPAFWRYLDLLPRTRFLVTLRHPVEVIGSFKRAGGRLAEGLEYDIAFHRRMNDELAATSNLAVRRIRLFDQIHRRILPHLDRPNVLAVRYERWFTEPDIVLSEIGDFLGTDVARARAAIRPPVAGASPDDSERALVREHCRTAGPLGYPL